MRFFIYLSLVTSLDAEICVHKDYEKIGNLENSDVNESPLRTLAGVSNSLECSVACFEDTQCLNLRVHDGVCSLYDSNLQSGGSLPGASYYTKYGDLCPTVEGYILNASPLMCYKLSSDNLEWSEAESQCQTEGGQLIVLNQLDKHSFFKQFMSDESLDWAWVGVRNIGGEFVWVDGTLDESEWKSGGDNGDCGEITDQGTISYDCSSSVNYICEILLPA